MSTTLMLMLGLVCFVAAMLGAALGAFLIWRMVRQRLQAQQGALIGLLPAEEPAALAALTVQDNPPSAIDLAPLADHVAARLQAQMNSLFEAQNLTQAAAQQKAELSLHQALQRVPPLLQQAIQVELEFQATQQAQRDQAQLQQQQRWQAEQAQRDLQRDVDYEAQRAADLRVLLQALSAHPGVTPEPAVRLTATPVTARVLPTPASLSARQPELLLTPLARAEPVYPSEMPTRELTDAEIDALPPELPAAGLPRKRILPAPSKPVLKRL